MRRSLKHYNLDAILAVGYRVRSGRGTPSGSGYIPSVGVAGQRLHPDDERVKAGIAVEMNTSKNCLRRIRDIRNSERLFYQRCGHLRHERGL